MSNYPKVAILLAAYNGENWIIDQLDSILRQRNVDVTIYISIDKSSDSTLQIVQNISAKEPRIKCLPYGESFRSAAQNFYRLIADVDFSGFDFISFSDQDDIWFEDKLSRAIDSFVTDSHHAYSSNVVAFWSSGSRVMIDKAQAQKPYDYFFEAAGPGCTYVLPVFMAKKFQEFIRSRPLSAYKKIPHDWLLYAYIRSQGYKWWIDPKPSMDYRQHERNVVGANVGTRAMILRWRQIFFDADWVTHVYGIAQLLNLESHPVIKNFQGNSIFSKLQLALQASSCRRRLRDQAAFMLIVLIYGVKDLVSKVKLQK